MIKAQDTTVGGTDFLHQGNSTQLNGISHGLNVERAFASTCLPVFSEQENPFLYPRHLLNGALPAAGNVEFDPSSPDVPVWWLLHTKPRQEKKLAEALLKYEIPHYLPVSQHKAVTRGRTRTTLASLFSGYFFLWATPAQRIRALETNRIVATHEVEDGARLGKRLFELAELIEQGVPLTVEARLTAGRKVRVKSGSFKGMEGTVLQRAGKTRLFIMVNELLGGVSLEVEEHQIAPIY